MAYSTETWNEPDATRFVIFHEGQVNPKKPITVRLVGTVAMYREINVAALSSGIQLPTPEEVLKYAGYGEEDASATKSEVIPAADSFTWHQGIPDMVSYIAEGARRSVDNSPLPLQSEVKAVVYGDSQPEEKQAVHDIVALISNPEQEVPSLRIDHSSGEPPKLNTGMYL